MEYAFFFEWSYDSLVIYTDVTTIPTRHDEDSPSLLSNTRYVFARWAITSWSVEYEVRFKIDLLDLQKIKESTESNGL